MWDELPVSQRNEYKRMILTFASLTEMFAQKADSYKETVKPQTLNVLVTNLKEYADLPYSSKEPDNSYGTLSDRNAIMPCAV